MSRIRVSTLFFATFVALLSFSSASAQDTQLEAAVEEALRLLETEAVELKPEPAAPIRYRRPIRRGGGDR
jgi:hypothetical protein